MSQSNYNQTSDKQKYLKGDQKIRDPLHTEEQRKVDLDSSSEMRETKDHSEIPFKELKGKNQHRILYPAQMSFKNEAQLSTIYKKEKYR